MFLKTTQLPTTYLYEYKTICINHLALTDLQHCSFAY